MIGLVPILIFFRYYNKNTLDLGALTTQIYLWFWSQESQERITESAWSSSDKDYLPGL